jgi:hypothetical protein
MKKSILNAEEKERAERFGKLISRTLLLIMWSVVMLLVGLTGGFELGEQSGYNSGEIDGYRRAKSIYECDHDRSECEMLNENY